ncbi:MAG: hypothetical protein ACMUJM_23625 [bacterium]
MIKDSSARSLRRVAIVIVAIHTIILGVAVGYLYISEKRHAMEIEKAKAYEKAREEAIESMME